MYVSVYIGYHIISSEDAALIQVLQLRFGSPVQSDQIE